ncbi:DUF4145 domain-containing protein [Bradyrhizobium ottawaense]|jgi:hypothetical protein|uniref:DUF4145 domain-containing protein n=1 Tax=Bradyrhizobium ottawaense TaxID=931866 RepID=UPI001BA617F3|nr:DUF4145 domain-containing protein [Bradyrhizobium ottawaense]MBR1360772.1 DUF4145 domain-containing protein [Bradyrhizobium ottawaense]
MSIAPNFVPNDSNFFRADAGISQETPRYAVSIRCPHCRELGSFNCLGSARAYSKVGKIGVNQAVAMYYAAIRVCPNVKCKGLVFVIEDDKGTVEIEPPQLLDFNPEGLSPRLQQTLKEAVACHGAGAYRAAAMMVRRLLEEICEENNAAGANLHQRLAALKSAIVLPEPLFEAMNELKALGNDATHVEAKAYDNIGTDEAQDSIELAKEIVKSLYQLKGLIARLQSRKAI